MVNVCSIIILNWCASNYCIFSPSILSNIYNKKYSAIFSVVVCSFFQHYAQIDEEVLFFFLSSKNKNKNTLCLSISVCLFFMHKQNKWNVALHLSKYLKLKKRKKKEELTETQTENGKE